MSQNAMQVMHARDMQKTSGRQKIFKFLSQFGIYLFLLILIYNVIYFTLLIFNFHDIGQILLSALLGTVVTWVLAILYQTLLLKKNDH